MTILRPTRIVLTVAAALALAAPAAAGAALGVNGEVAPTGSASAAVAPLGQDWGWE